MLYELLTGEPPFTASTPSGVLAKHISEPPRPPREQLPGLSPPLNDIVLALLAKDPADRPATAADVARALRAAAPITGPVALPAPSSDADRLVDQGLKAIFHSVSATSRRSHLDQAEVYLKRALQLDPRNARGLCAMANWYYTMGRAGFRQGR